MKQTLEEEASAYLQKILESTDFEVNFEEDNYDAGSRDAVFDVTERAFIAGAEWQSKQSPWISVKERLPEPNKLVLCRMVSNGAIVSGYIVVSSGRSPYVATDGGFEFEDWNDYECDMWMPIPSFDEILEANT